MQVEREVWWHMRICYVAFQFWPSVGGSQTQAEKQARYLRQLGQDVLVVTLRHRRAWPAREVHATYPVVRVGGWYRRGGVLRVGRLGHLWVDLCLFLQLWRLRHKYDVIHTLQLSPLAVVATLIGKLTHKPVIIGIQSTGRYAREIDPAVQAMLAQAMPEAEARPIQTRSDSVHNADRCVEDTQEGSAQVKPADVESDGASQAEKLSTSWTGDAGETMGLLSKRAQEEETGGDIACLQQTSWGGQWMLNYLRRSNAYYQILSSRSYLYLMQHNFRPERIIYIPNGVDVEQFYPVGWAWPACMPQPTERILLCVARLEYAKGIDVLLHAWAQMLAMPADWRAGLHLRLCLAGDGSRRAELEQLAATLGIQKSVEFYGTCHDIPRLLQSSWAFVLPSRWEGMPNALLEAMACALPCVATRVSGSEDLIEQGVNGLLVEPEKPEQMAYALRLVLEDIDLARQLGWQAYETVLRYHQLGLTVQNCLDFYRYLLARDAAHRHPTVPLKGGDLSPEEWQRQ